MGTATKTYRGTGEQPWFVLNAVAGLRQYSSTIQGISQIYRFQAGKHFEATYAIPDGCVDIMFDCSDTRPNATICGSTLCAQNAELKKGHDYFGVRFTPGTVPKYIDISAKSLISQRFNLFDIINDQYHLMEQLLDCDDFNSQAQIIEKYLSTDSLLTPSAKTQTALNTIIQYSGNIQINQLESLTSISKRTLQRLFREELGMSPKAFSRVIRCQSAVSQINQNSDLKFIELAHELGFSDQPHFMREFKSLVNTTPSAYQRTIAHSSYDSHIITL